MGLSPFELSAYGRKGQFTLEKQEGRDENGQKCPETAYRIACWEGNASHLNIFVPAQLAGKDLETCKGRLEMSARELDGTYAAAEACR